METEQTIGNKIASALVVIYMIALVGSMFLFSQTNPKLVITSFGTMILLLGVACIVGGKQDGFTFGNVIGSLLFSLAGICMIVFPLLLLYAPSFANVDGSKIGVTLVALFTMAVGVTFWSGLYAITLYRKKRCNLRIQAQVVDVEEHRRIRNSITSVRGRRKRARSFIFAFTLNGQEYRVKDPIGSNMDFCDENAFVWLQINPENPQEFYRFRPITYTCLFAVGAVFFAMGALCLVVLI